MNLGLGLNRMGGSNGGIKRFLQQWFPLTSSIDAARGTSDATFTRSTIANYPEGTQAIDTAGFTSAGIWSEPAATNLFLNSQAAVTQNIAVIAQAYTLAFTGTGNIVRSGTSTGTLTGTSASNRVSVTFTPTAGTLTLTVNGTCSDVQLETGLFPTSPIITLGAAVARGATVVSTGVDDIPTSGDRTFIGSFTPSFTATGVIPTQTEWSSWTDSLNEISLNYNGVIAYLLKRVAGVNEYVTVPYVPTKDVACNWEFTINADNTMNLWINGVQDLGGFGSELVDTMNTATAWTPYGANTTVDDAGEVKTTYVNNASGSISTLTAVGGLSSNLTAGLVYKSSNVARVNTGAVSQILDAGSGILSQNITSVAGVPVSFNYIRTGASTPYITFSGMGAGEIIWTSQHSTKQVYNDTTTLAVVLGTTQQIGSRNSLQQTQGNNKEIKLYNRLV